MLQTVAAMLLRLLSLLLGAAEAWQVLREAFAATLQALHTQAPQVMPRRVAQELLARLVVVLVETFAAVERLWAASQVMQGQAGLLQLLK
jgi:hypothetical protein